MIKFVDLVLIEHTKNGRRFLFQAPKFSYLSAGDLVIVETKHGEQAGTVVDVITLDDGCEAFNFAVACAEAKLPLKKVLRKVEFKEFEYKEETPDE